MTLTPAAPQAVVIFGASGDLTTRKLIPAFFHLFLEGLLPEHLAIVGYGRKPMTDEQFRNTSRVALEKYARTQPRGEDWARFAERMSYVQGNADEPNAMEPLCRYLEKLDETRGTAGGRFYYCATPPGAYAKIAHRLGECNMQHGARIVIEKPFGRDLESARKLNQELHEVFAEDQIFRIDHYLGKETVQNILAFRFANGMFEPIWNRRYIDNVQITVAESIGIEGRGGFFEQTGSIRDMVQPHLFQMMTFVAMEPPVSFHPDRLRDEKVRVLRSARPVSPERVVRGQFVGYRNEPEVASDSQTETFVAMQMEIDNWRWAGVPFNLRTGKKLQRKATEISLQFRKVPYNVFKPGEEMPQGRNSLVIRVYPTEGISLHLNVKEPGVGMHFGEATLDFDYEKAFTSPLAEAYELLILEAMHGDHTLFTREDEVEQSWELLKPVLEHPPRVRFYEPGSWGPDEAEQLMLPRHWHLYSSQSA